MQYVAVAMFFVCAVSSFAPLGVWCVPCDSHFARFYVVFVFCAVHFCEDVCVVCLCVVECAVFSA